MGEKLTFIDLFSGTGAFSYVLEKNMCKCVFSNDIINESKLIYSLNNNSDSFHLGDINNIEIDKIPKFDLLCGGFPCQPFSIAGKREGFNDSRTNVFWTILKILESHFPRFFILENVKNLLTHDNKNTFTIIKKSLEGIGYKIKYKVLDTSKVSNIPQHRERIYIIGFRETTDYNNFNFDFPNTKTKDVSIYFEKDVDSKYFYNNNSKIYNTLITEIIKDIETNTVYQYRRHYVRENKSGLVPTLTANMGSGGNNVPIIKINDGKIRKLTPRECFNLQGFPKDYKLPKISDCKLYKLAGNAVSIPVIELIINKLLYH